MRYGRYVFWLLLVPAALLVFAWKMNSHLADVRSGALEEREYAERMAARAAQNERETERYLAARVEERRDLAKRCVARALQTFGDPLASAAATLVIVNFKGCGVDCDTDAIATRLADEYAIQRLHVLLIRTIEDQRLTAAPGVETITMTDCQPLVSDYGDDYFFRNVAGELSSSGERHEGYLLRRIPPSASFDPEPLVREGLWGKRD
jgi:hypothetical protein